jgi:hypothetical protein
MFLPLVFMVVCDFTPNGKRYLYCSLAKMVILFSHIWHNLQLFLIEFNIEKILIFFAALYQYFNSIMATI